MGFLSWFCVESKVFELSAAEGASGLRFVERSHGVVRAVFVGKLNILRLLSVVEKLVKGEVTTWFFKSPRDGNKVFSAQQCANQSGRYLAVTEYGSGGQRRFLVIPEERKGRGWRSCASKLRKVVDFLDMPYSKGGAPLSQWPFGGSTLYDVGSASLVSMGKPCGIGGSASG